jgi:RNA polymerase sigma factor (sigma-70 family)
MLERGRRAGTVAAWGLPLVGHHGPLVRCSVPLSTYGVMSTLRDADLVVRCRGGDAEAWRTLVERFSRYVYAIAVQVYRLSDDRAEDVFQEVFARAYEHLAELRDDRALRPWIGQLTRRLAVDQIRRDRRTESRSAMPDVPEADDRMATIDQALTVHAALGELSEDCREVLDRFFCRDQSYEAISAALGIPTGTIASRISRCLVKLRAQLQPP